MSAPMMAPERVLPTMNLDGSRRLIWPRLSPGRFWWARRIVAYALMLVFFLIPYLRYGGKPLVLLDIPRRQFVLFGYTFLPTDTLLFILLQNSCPHLRFKVLAAPMTGNLEGRREMAEPSMVAAADGGCLS